MGILILLVLVALAGGWAAVFDGLGGLVKDLGKLLAWVVAIPFVILGTLVVAGGSKPHYKSKHFPHYDPMNTAIVVAGIFCVGMFCLCIFG